MDPTKGSAVQPGPTGPTVEIEDLDHPGSLLLDTIGSMAQDRNRLDLRSRFMTVESQQAAVLRNQALLERDQINAALLQDHRWYDQHWQWNKIFCAALLVCTAFMGVFAYTGSFLTLWLAALCFTACAGWAVFVLTFFRQPAVGNISHVGPPSDVIES